jgi:hypothetical protein
MQSESKERWMLLCEQAATEKNSEKLIELIKEINKLLEERRLRLNQREANQTVGDGLTVQLGRA